MTERTARGPAEWGAFGVVAGILFASMATAAAALMGASPLAPLRSFASVVLGESALTTPSVGVVIIVGILAHLTLSAIFGLLYGLVNARFSEKTETSWARQAGLGLLYGVLIWVVNIKIVAVVLYPWLVDNTHPLPMLMHALFFGLPLALIYAAAERRFHHVARAPEHA